MGNSQEEWEKIIVEMRSSGMSQKRWCQENGINYSTMRGWASKINKIKTKNSEDASAVLSQDSICNWVKVENPSTNPEGSLRILREAPPDSNTNH